MPEVIGPSYVGRRERLRIEVARLGGIEVRRSHQEFAKLAVSRAERGVVGARVHDLPGE